MRMIKMDNIYPCQWANDNDDFIQYVVYDDIMKKWIFFSDLKYVINDKKLALLGRKKYILDKRFMEDNSYELQVQMQFNHNRWGKR